MTDLCQCVENIIRDEALRSAPGQPVRTLDEMPELPPQPIAPIPKSPEAA